MGIYDASERDAGDLDAPVFCQVDRHPGWRCPHRPPPLVLPFVTKHAALPNALHMREVVRAAPDLVALLQ